MRIGEEKEKRKKENTSHFESVKRDPGASMSSNCFFQKAAIARNKRNDIYLRRTLKRRSRRQTMFTKDHVVPRRIDNAVKAPGLFGNRIIRGNYSRAPTFLRNSRDRP